MPKKEDFTYTPAEYTINPSDVIDISIHDLFATGKETVLQREVTAKGLIDLPMLKDRIKAAGLTGDQLKKAIANAYKKPNILSDPVISVTIAKKRAQTFSILGSIKRPGSYAISRPDMRVIDALALALGVTFSDLKYLYVIRLTADGPRTIAINLPNLKAGDWRQNIIIRDGDAIFVPLMQVGEFYVMGDVPRPGVYSLTGRNVTVKMAIAAAGVDDIEKLPASTLIRRVNGNKEEFLPLNLQGIFNGQKPDMFLQPNDVIIVGKKVTAKTSSTINNKLPKRIVTPQYKRPSKPETKRLARLKEREADLKLQLAGAQREGGPNHKTTKKVKEQLEDVQQLITELQVPAQSPKAVGPTMRTSSVIFTAPYDGVLAKVNVTPSNNRVRKGQLIAQLDTSELELELAKNQAELKLARKYLPLKEAQHKEGTLSSLEAEEAKTCVKIAEISVKQIELKIRKSRFVAPFDGEIVFYVDGLHKGSPVKMRERLFIVGSLPQKIITPAAQPGGTVKTAP